MLKKVLRPRIELGTYRVLGGRHNQLDHRSPLSGTRTPSFRYRLPDPPAALDRLSDKRDCLRRGSNSCILRILELKSSALDHSATEAPAPSEIRTRVQCLGSIDDNPYTNGARLQYCLVLSHCQPGVGDPKSATSWDRSRDLQIFSLTLSQLS